MNLGSIWVLTKNSIKEAMRDKIYLMLFFVFVMLVGISILLGEMSFAEQQRILANVSLTAAHIVALGMSVFIGSFSISREVDKQTYMVILVRPLDRLHFLLGKFFGIALSLFVTLVCLLLIIAFIFIGSDKFLNLTQIFWSLYLEGLILLGLSFLLSLVMRPIVGIFSALSIYLIGQWLSELQFFAEKSKSEVFIQFAKIIKYVFPNLNQLNYRSFLFVEEGIKAQNIVWFTLHGFVWIVATLTLSIIIFRRKDLV